MTLRTTTDFEELNLIAYYSLLNLVLDLVIWCLGPCLDDSRDYALPRHVLAAVTRRVCGVLLAAKNGKARRS